jgi:hypothetical protein
MEEQGQASMSRAVFAARISVVMQPTAVRSINGGAARSSSESDKPLVT